MMKTESVPAYISLAHGLCLASILTLASASPAQAQIARYEENEPSVAYVGFWLARNNTGGIHFWSGGTAQSTYEAGARATFTFEGTGVTWIGFRNNVTGIARVYVDGVLVAVVDTAGPSPSPTGVWQVPMYTVQSLPRGRHTIAIEATGDYNRVLSNGAWIVVDAFDVTL